VESAKVPELTHASHGSRAHTLILVLQQNQKWGKKFHATRRVEASSSWLSSGAQTPASGPMAPMAVATVHLTIYKMAV
jgi:hypothetical protein